MGSVLKKSVMFSFNYDTDRRSQALFFYKVFLAYSQAFEGYRTKATLFLMFSQTRYIRIPHLM